MKTYIGNIDGGAVLHFRKPVSTLKFNLRSIIEKVMPEGYKISWSVGECVTIKHRIFDGGFIFLTIWEKQDTNDTRNYERVTSRHSDNHGWAGCYLDTILIIPVDFIILGNYPKCEIRKVNFLTKTHYYNNVKAYSLAQKLMEEIKKKKLKDSV